MTTPTHRFDRFTLDPTERRLSRNGQAVALSGRYLDALLLLVREQGRLVTKARFIDEVWRGAAVTDEALTQAIRTLRRALGDDAGSPRFIETVPGHGYRFIATIAGEPAEPGARLRPGLVVPTTAAALGGAAAGVFGGLLYGLGAAEPGLGLLSILLVLLLVNVLVGLLGGAGVGLGVALMQRRGGSWLVLGGAMGGLCIGAAVHLLGADAFALLFGGAPARMTGAVEGALLGAAVGLGLFAGLGRLRRTVAAAGVAGAVVGVLAPLLGGRLMGGSLDGLARAFPGSRLRLDRIGGLIGEPGFGPVAQAATGALEGLIFCAFVAGAAALAKARGAPPPR